jgi:hypothetical protein
VVSGRITATLPLPDDASDESCWRAEKELFRSETEIDGALAELLELDVAPPAGAELELELELLPLELQAAISSAALTPAATTPTFLMEDTNVPRLIFAVGYGAGRERYLVHAGQI